MQADEIRAGVLDATADGRIPQGGPSEIAARDLADEVPAGYWDRWSGAVAEPFAATCPASAGSPAVSELAPIPRFALTREEAAASIGMSLDSFERHVQPHLRILRLGRMRLVPVRELERWTEEHAERAV